MDFCLSSTGLILRPNRRLMSDDLFECLLQLKCNDVKYMFDITTKIDEGVHPSTGQQQQQFD